MADDVDKVEKRGIDRRLVYILPSVLALCISLTTCVFVFRSYLFDLQNIRYTVYLEADQADVRTDTDEECLALINEVMAENGASGFTVNRSLQGAFIDEDGQLTTQVSYQVIFMDISKDKATQIASSLREAFGTDVALVEMNTNNSSCYITERGVFTTALEALAD